MQDSRLEPLYPITTDVLYTVCNPIGSVLRIVIFKRNGIQAMISRFESIQCAQKAKAALNGADIYAGCCTLKIEYARDRPGCGLLGLPVPVNCVRSPTGQHDPIGLLLQPDGGIPYFRCPPPGSGVAATTGTRDLASHNSANCCVDNGGREHGPLGLNVPQPPSESPTRLNVIKNDNESWDYTKPYLVRRDRGKGRQRQAILGEHPSSYSDNGYGPPCPLLPLPGNSRYKLTSVDVPDMVSYPLPQSSSSYSGHAPSSVAMVSGLHPSKMNCTRIFNLFCLYGNIEKVKFMKSVPGTALVEMGDEYAVDRAITHLNSIKVFGKRLNVCVSKQHAVIPSQVFELEDGSSSYKDFAMTRNNRFSSAGQASKNIIQPPSAVLHYYNVPPCISQDHLLRLCTEHDVPGFVKFKMFDAKPSSKTISGLLEFDSKTEAVEVLTVLNHYQIRIPNGSNPYTLKLCFSTSSHL
ncbi:hypothetical protein L3Q82_011524 [Scortum barcoo]|uniref:Uncharacterized protein n=1 Tax=Scortum barcoo TaxID=214431 RepID=A0ACB8W5P3_9TELE|nr:hypothetical protein L3Q82_011524 [Scortum barcoo]